jgi:glycosyltransferase involved in cell wall biosynthesis
MSYKHHPKLTVLMSVYNGMPYLTEAVESILKQTYKDFVFLIIDDGSTDGTFDWLKKINDERVQIFHQKNSGLGAALNTGLSMIDSKLVARMDADDIALPERLEKQMKFMEENQNVGMAGCGFAFTLDGATYAAAPPLPLMHDRIVNILLKGGHAISHPTIIFRLAIARDIGGYRIKGVGQDWDFLIRMGEAARLSNLSEILQLYRLQPKSSAWKAVENTIRGQEFAMTCAQKRIQGAKEPSIKEFYYEWDNRAWIARLRTRLECISAVNYRQYVVAYLEKRRTMSLVWLMVACVCSPWRVILRLQKSLFSRCSFR